MAAIISCLTNSYGRFGVEAAVELLSAADIHHIELPIRTAGQPSFFKEDPILTSDSTLVDLKNVDQLLEKHSVQVSSCNITTGNPLDETSLEITKKKLNFASHFGVNLVVGGAGEVEDKSQLPNLYDHLRQIGDCAAKLGITYCFETHPGICQHHGGMLETMQELDHPHLKLNFDTANILYYNEKIEGEVALAKVCQHVAHIHLKDSMGEFKQWYFPALGNGGAVDFVRILEIMKTVGFNGPYSLEIEGIEGEPELTLEQHHQRIADSVKHLKNCGYYD